MSDLTLIETRRAEISAALRDMDERRSRFQAELEELDIAAKVIARLNASPNPKAVPGFTELSANAHTSSTEDRGKPENTPTVPEMILWVLEQARQRGVRGLEPKQMRPLIAEKWWPDVPGETINSIAWRMWKRQQVVKDGSIYMLPF